MIDYLIYAIALWASVHVLLLCVGYLTSDKAYIEMSLQHLGITWLKKKFKK